MKKLTKIILIIFLIGSIVYSQWSIVNAAVPRLINYQGRLTNPSGVPLNGSYSITFRIYDAGSGGNLLWFDTFSGIVVEKGLFSVQLGSGKLLDLSFDKQYYLSIQVGSDPEMNPRQQITSAGYAVRAEKAESAEGTIKATGGLIMETRTSDPSSPTTGQIWLRTDL